MPAIALSLALMSAGQAGMAAPTPIVFRSAAEAFERGILACEEVYAGTLRREKSAPNKPGPFSQRGFYMSATGDEAKVNTLTLGRESHVYKGSIAGGAGVVYIVFSLSPLACRVGSFDAPASEAVALGRLAESHSGWVAQQASSPSPTAKMQMFQKQISGTLATLNISWPIAQGMGPNGLSAMATMVVQESTRASPQPIAVTAASFANCLKAAVQLGMRMRMDPTAFKAGFAQRCLTEERAFRIEGVKEAMRQGRTQAQAAEEIDGNIARGRRTFAADQESYVRTGIIPH